MITAQKAYENARKFTHEGWGKECFTKLRDDIDYYIFCESESGYRATCFTKDKFDNVAGIEFIIDELRENGFTVTVNRDERYRFESMYVSW